MLSILTSSKPWTGLTTNCCSRSSTDSASALPCWLGSKTISPTTSRGSPLSESKARLSLCHQACGKDQYLDLSCSSYMWLNDLPVTWRPLFLSLPMTRGASGQRKAWRMVLANSVTSNTSTPTHDVISGKSETLINPSACYFLSPEMLVRYTSPINYPMFKLRRWKLKRTLGF